MITGKLDVIGLFGILIPGIYLVGILTFAGVISVVVCGHCSVTDVFGFIHKQSVTLGSIFLLVSYLVGVVLRLMSSSKIDTLSSYYQRIVRFKKKGDIEDFPYKEKIRTNFESGGVCRINTFMASLNPLFNKEKNTQFFNYCKIIIGTNNKELAIRIAQAEAMVRFLAGSAIALIISSLVLIIIPITLEMTLYLMSAAAPIDRIAIYLPLLISLMLLHQILIRYKHQRQLEVALVWFSIYGICHGAIPIAEGCSRVDIQSALTMTGNDSIPEVTDSISKNEPGK